MDRNVSLYKVPNMTEGMKRQKAEVEAEAED